MQFVCATHPNVEAAARCVACGIHLCEQCRVLDGVRNLCSICHERLARSQPQRIVAQPREHALAIEIPSPSKSQPRPVTPRSPILSAMLSMIPGLGQLYTGRPLRGALFFGSAIALRHAPFLTPPLAAFFYVFNLFDAWRLAQNRKEGLARGRAPLRTDDTIFFVLGLGVLAATFLHAGGFMAAPHSTLYPLAALTAGLAVAHETRR